MLKVCIRALQPIILDRTSNYRDFPEGMHSINPLVDHNLIIPTFIKVYIQETLLEDISSNVALRTFIQIHTIQNIQREHYKKIFHRT